MKSNVIQINQLSEREQREQHMLDTITQLIREAAAEKLHAVEAAAAEAAEDTDDEDDKPVLAKLGISVKWEAGKPVPEIEVKVSYSIRRSVTVCAPADGNQIKLPLNN